MPVVGEYRARSPRAAGSIRAMPVADHLESTQPVGVASPLEIVEARELGLADRHDQLAGLRMRDAMGIAERPQLGGTANAESGFE